MQQVIRPARGISGALMVPGDKSISHRYAMLAAIAEGQTKIRNYSSGADCHSTLAVLEALGVKLLREDRDITIEGVGLRGFKPPSRDLDCGNSGSTIRMMSGILAGQPFKSRLTGDESLSRRPMKRIMAPLRQMGASVEAREDNFTPLVIRGGELRPLDYTPPVASAQVKTCVLLAGLYARGETVFREAVRTRDHTELALREFGAEIRVAPGLVAVTGPAVLKGGELRVPGDISSAAFFLVAALLFPDSRLTIAGVGMNPTRSLLLDFLTAMGARFKILQIGESGGELLGDLQIRGGPVRGGEIKGAVTAALIDEIPALSILGAISENGLRVRDAQELRVKETDRIRAIVENLRRMGVRAEEREDGLEIPGRQQFQGAAVDSFGDHRIAMAFAVAGLAARGETIVEGAEAASVSFPEFFDTLRLITQ
ncbi:MAG: 3-phosphoshikimate 1-carboxyvinyltransferase [Bryobacteraceae bacterium]|nr:3-phosphoshikimate 1-carboxyvinyltransferase [Bryobacteraceae bacterium]